MEHSARYRFFHPHRVRYAEIDSQEIVFNSRYLEFCDEAATEYLRAAGFSPHEIVSSHHCDLVVVRAEVEFIAPARLDDLLHVYVRTSNLGRSSIVKQFEVRRSVDDALCARASITYVNFNRATRKAIAIPASVREGISAFEGTAG